MEKIKAIQLEHCRYGFPFEYHGMKTLKNGFALDFNGNPVIYSHGFVIPVTEYVEVCATEYSNDMVRFLKSILPTVISISKLYCDDGTTRITLEVADDEMIDTTIDIMPWVTHGYTIFLNTWEN